MPKGQSQTGRGEVPKGPGQVGRGKVPKGQNQFGRDDSAQGARRIQRMEKSLTDLATTGGSKFIALPVKFACKFDCQISENNQSSKCKTFCLNKIDISLN